MGRLAAFYIRLREFQKGLSKGQTMTEYALILAAVAVVVFVTYETMGNDISLLVNQIDTDLTAAAS
jgi:Flp pilus assembly pilin Flp